MAEETKAAESHEKFAEGVKQTITPEAKKTEETPQGASKPVNDNDGFKQVSTPEELFSGQAEISDNGGAQKGPTDNFFGFDLNEARKDDGQGAPKTDTQEVKADAMLKLLDPDLIIGFANVMLSRVGAMASKKPIEFWSLTDDEKKEIKPLLAKTIEEENWTNIPAKWLLIGVVTVMYGSKVAVIMQEKAEEKALRDKAIKAGEEAERKRRMVEPDVEPSYKENPIHAPRYERVQPEQRVDTRASAEVETPERKGGRIELIKEIREKLLKHPDMVFEPSMLNFELTQDEIAFILKGNAHEKKYSKNGRWMGNRKGSKHSGVQDVDFVDITAQKP